MPRWLAWFLNSLVPAPKPPKPAPILPPAPAPPRPSPPPTPPAAEVVAALNEERSGFGLGPLAIDPELARIAQAWATRMALDDTLTHGNFAGRIASVHPDSPAAENIAEGYPDAASLVAGWMASPDHRANILGHFSHVGAGADVSRNWHIYWVVDLCLLIDPSA